MSDTLSKKQLELIDAYWRAANYLTVGQIYLQENPLLREPLLPEHIKPRLLGHWGTSPGLSFIYAHLNRLIQDTDANVIYLTGPGHGGPAMVANVYLEGTYSEIYPQISRDTAGLRRLFRQFSTPGGMPSHVSVPTPGSIHEGGELGYVLVHAFGAVFDNPDLIAVAVVGDGEAETGPLAGLLEKRQLPEPGPRRRRAAGPAPERLQDLRSDGARAAIATTMSESSSKPTVTKSTSCEGDDPLPMHQAFAATLDSATRKSGPSRLRRAPTACQAADVAGHRTSQPKGWTGPKIVDGSASRGHLPRAPGAAPQREGQPRASARCWSSG